jgi:N-dimethylarginine dimethylaminohydrolase
MAILMCRPDFFGVEYEINPWMHVATKVDRTLARTQWDALHRTYTEMGEHIELAEPVKGLPDMVFTANAAVLHKGQAVLSNFHDRERQGEESHWRVTLEQLGLEVHQLPHTLAFEGAGDALFVGEQLYCGPVGRLLSVEVVSLQLIDPRFYHLDTCFCPLDARTVLFAPDAFTADSARTVRSLVPHVIEVPVDVAAGFACNAMPVGDCVVSSLAAGQLEAELAQAGFGTIELPMSEFMKAGGGVRCLSLPLAA